MTSGILSCALTVNRPDAVALKEHGRCAELLLGDELAAEKAECQQAQAGAEKEKAAWLRGGSNESLRQTVACRHLRPRIRNIKLKAGVEAWVTRERVSGNEIFCVSQLASYALIVQAQGLQCTRGQRRGSAHYPGCPLRVGDCLRGGAITQYYVVQISVFLFLGGCKKRGGGADGSDGGGPGLGNLNLLQVADAHQRDRRATIDVEVVRVSVDSAGIGASNAGEAHSDIICVGK